MMGMKRIIGIGLAMLCCGLSVSAIDSAQTGSWSDTATWVGGVVPGPADNVVVKHTITSDGDEGSVNELTINEASAVLNMNSGSLLGSTRNTKILNGSMNIASNATFTHDAAANRYISLALADSADGYLNINGGSVTTMSTLIIGSGLSTGGATGSLTVNSGSLAVTGPRIQFGGADGASMSLNLNGGTVSASTVSFVNDGLGTKRLNVNGGALYLNNATETNTLVFTDTSARLMFESGLVIFEGVDTAGDFNGFTNTFYGWVDAQNIDSATYTDQQLKDFLIYDEVNSNAVLTVSSAPDAATIAVTFAANSLLITSTNLTPAASHTLQTTADLVDGTWSNLTTSTGSSSNTWIITPLVDPERFYRIISE